MEEYERSDSSETESSVDEGGPVTLTCKRRINNGQTPQQKRSLNILKEKIQAKTQRMSAKNPIQPRFLDSLKEPITSTDTPARKRLLKKSELAQENKTEVQELAELFIEKAVISSPPIAHSCMEDASHHAEVIGSQPVITAPKKRLLKKSKQNTFDENNEPPTVKQPPVAVTAVSIIKKQPISAAILLVDEKHDIPKTIATPRKRLLKKYQPPQTAITNDNKPTPLLVNTAALLQELAETPFTDQDFTTSSISTSFAPKRRMKKSKSVNTQINLEEGEEAIEADPSEQDPPIVIPKLFPTPSLIPIPVHRKKSSNLREIVTLEHHCMEILSTPSKPRQVFTVESVKREVAIAAEAFSSPPSLPLPTTSQPGKSKEVSEILSIDNQFEGLVDGEITESHKSSIHTPSPHNSIAPTKTSEVFSVTQDEINHSTVSSSPDCITETTQKGINAGEAEKKGDVAKQLERLIDDDRRVTKLKTNNSSSLDQLIDSMQQDIKVEVKDNLAKQFENLFDEGNDTAPSSSEHFIATPQKEINVREVGENESVAKQLESLFDDDSNDVNRNTDIPSSSPYHLIETAQEEVKVCHADTKENVVKHLEALFDEEDCSEVDDSTSSTSPVTKNKSINKTVTHDNTSAGSKSKDDSTMEELTDLFKEKVLINTSPKIIPDGSDQSDDEFFMPNENPDQIASYSEPQKSDKAQQSFVISDNEDEIDDAKEKILITSDSDSDDIESGVLIYDGRTPKPKPLTKPNIYIHDYIPTLSSTPIRTPFKVSTPTTTNKSLALFKRQRVELARSYFHEFNKNIFNSSLSPTMEIKWLNSLSKTAGRTVTIRNKAPTGFEYTCSIELSSKILDTDEKLRTTLVHEMTHAAAWIIDHNNNPPHGPIFKKWARRVEEVYHDLKITTCHSYEINYKYWYVCIGCSSRYGRHSKSIDVGKFGCGKCSGRLCLEGAGSGLKKDGTPRKQGAFSIYMKERYKSVKDENPGILHGEIMKLLSAKYKSEKENNGAVVDVSN